MPRDYRNGSGAGTVRAGTRRSRQPVTVTRVAPKPADGPTGPLGAYTPEHRAAYALQGIPVGAARRLFDAGVHPDSVIDWTAAGVALTSYDTMAWYAEAGISPALYSRWAAVGLLGVAIASHRQGISPEEARSWSDARHAGVCQTPKFCPCPGPMGPENVRWLRERGKTPAWLTRAADACAGKRIGVPTLLSMVKKDIPVGMIPGLPLYPSSVAWNTVSWSAVKTAWDGWVAAAGNDPGAVEVARAVAGAGGTISGLRDWMTVGLPSERVALLVRAGFSGAEALVDRVAALTDAQLRTMAALRGASL